MALVPRLRQTLAWSAWRDRLIGLAFIAVAAALIYIGTQVALWLATALWIGFALALVVASRFGWLKLFGPVLLYDMIRTARRARYSIIRILYGGLLVFILFYMFLMLSLTVNNQQIQRLDMAMLAQSFFLVFVLLQLFMVILLTPAYVAGAIAEEKDRKTLEFLLATDLHDREIILSKLLSRLANMTLLLLTGLPILSILQFLGGVDTELMLAGFLAIGLTMLGLAGVSILLSTLFKKPRDAISLSYLLIVAYFALATTGLIMQSSRVPLMHEPLWFGDAGPSLSDISNVINAGNPIAAITDVMMAINGRNRLGGGGTNITVELPAILSRYAWFHLSLALVTIVWSIVRMRAIALKQTVGGTTAKLAWWQRLRPRVGEFPMLWKEFYIEGRMKLNWLLWIAVIILVLLTLGSGLWVLGYHLLHGLNFGFGGEWRNLSEAMNAWFRIAGTGVSLLMLVMLAVRASASISSERERDTFDALITSPLSAENILIAKLIGNLTSLRYAWAWYGVMLLLAVVTGGVHPLAVPILVVAWFIYAVFVTMLGLWFSMLCRSSMMATFNSVLATLVLGGGHWMITYCCGMPLAMVVFMLVEQNFPQVMNWEWALYLLKFQACLTPPAVFGFGAFSWQDLDRNFQPKQIAEMFAFAMLGLFLWCVACVIVWFGFLVPTFRRLTRRIELIYK